MNTKIAKCTNAHFCVRYNKDQKSVTATLINAVIPAEKWNELRDNICNESTFSDDTTVYFDYLIINGEVDRFSYVTIGDWRRLGFSANNVKNCIPAAPEYVIKEANKFFYYNNEILKLGTLCGRKLERVQQMISKQIFETEMTTLAASYRNNLREVGMTDEEITEWFERVVHDVYHPKF